MKKALLSILMLVGGFSLLAQTDVALKINHKLGTENFEYGAVATNNLGHEFKAIRLEYYLTKITIVHDGGTETAVPMDVVTLVQPGTELSTTIELGNFDVTDVESVKFYIGVYEPVNNADPSLFPEDHPLAPKSPSMHWGWAAGYRFIAYEGSGGVDFSQNFQMHGLGNENYFEVSSDVDAEMVDGSIVMSINGNYVEGLRGIDLTAGVISHGATGEAQQVLENWRDFVFGLYYVGIEEETNNLAWSVYPNPSNGEVTITFEETTAISQVNIVNPLGEIIDQIVVNTDTKLAVSIENAGIYFITVIDTNGETIATEKVIVE